jgi:hypothetical protein
MLLQPAQDSSSNNLETWQANLLRDWSRNTIRAIRNEDLVCFSSVLHLNTDVTKAFFNLIQSDAHAQQASNT